MNSEPKHQRDEHYIIDICDKVLNLTASRQHRFEFLCGDAGTMLPVDAYYESLNLVVEYRETQHYKPNNLFDKPDRLTISGCHRGEQRRRYDERRQEVLPRHGIRLVVLRHDLFRQQGKNLRREAQDEVIVRQQLSQFLQRA